MKHKKVIYCVLFAILCLSFLSFEGCSFLNKKPQYALKKLSPKHYPNFYDDMAYDGLEHCIGQSLFYLKKLPSDRVFSFGKDSYSADHLIKSLELFLSFIQANPPYQELQEFIHSNYLIYKSVGNKKTKNVLFTGYYEPFLEGSLIKKEAYKYPIYSLPTDLTSIDLSLFSEKFQGEKKLVGRITDDNKVVPYYERKEIQENNVLDEKVEVIAWVNDKVDLFFLEIQGSGIVYLDNGEKINVHYHNSNGRPYHSIGKLLIDEGKIIKEEMSMQKIREYLNRHPGEVQKILNYNQSYIFFQKEDDGPFGCLAVKLTPGRSIALQRYIFPSAALGFIETQKPLPDGNGQIQKWTDFSRFILNQDTGGAIKGPGRADLFWGNGPYAEIAAGHMQHEGNLFFLILKPQVYNTTFADYKSDRF